MKFENINIYLLKMPVENHFFRLLSQNRDLSQVQPSINLEPLIQFLASKFNYMNYDARQ